MRGHCVTGVGILGLCASLAHAGGGEIAHRVLVSRASLDQVLCDGSFINFNNFAPPSIDGDRVLFYNESNDLDCEGVYSLLFEGGQASALYTRASYASGTQVLPYPLFSNQRQTIASDANAWPVPLGDGRVLVNSGTSLSLGEADGSIRRVASGLDVLPGMFENSAPYGVPVFWNNGLVAVTHFTTDIFGGNQGYRTLLHVDPTTVPSSLSLIAETGTTIEGVVYNDFASNFGLENNLFGITSASASAAAGGDLLYFRARNTGSGGQDAVFSLHTDGTFTRLFDLTTTLPSTELPIESFSAVMDADEEVLAFVAFRDFDAHLLMYRNGVLTTIADRASVSAALDFPLGRLEIRHVSVSEGRVAFHVTQPSGGGPPFIHAIMLYEDGELRTVLRTQDAIVAENGDTDGMVQSLRIGGQALDGERLVSRAQYTSGAHAIIASGIPFLDICEGDCDKNGVIDFSDLVCALFNFGTDDRRSDCDGNGEVDFNDLVCSLFVFGACE